MQTLAEKRKKNAEKIDAFYAKAAEMLAEAKTPQGIEKAYEYIEKTREKLKQN